jgi:hypothetical protein
MCDACDGVTDADGEDAAEPNHEGGGVREADGREGQPQRQ